MFRKHRKEIRWRITRSKMRALKDVDVYVRKKWGIALTLKMLFWKENVALFENKWHNGSVKRKRDLTSSSEPQSYTSNLKNDDIAGSRSTMKTTDTKRNNTQNCQKTKIILRKRTANIEKSTSYRKYLTYRRNLLRVRWATRCQKHTLNTHS